MPWLDTFTDTGISKKYRQSSLRGDDTLAMRLRQTSRTATSCILGDCWSFSFVHIAFGMLFAEQIVGERL